METHDGHPAPQTEHDKLGPLGTPGGELAHDSLRAALIGEFLAATEAARDAAAAVDAGATSAVHEYRKGLRRARAVLTLVGDALPKSERRAVKRALQEARRAVSSARDHAVAPETLAKLELDGNARAGADQVLANAAEAVPPVTEIKALLVDGASRALAQAEALEAALPRELELATVIEGVRGVFAEARAARRGARRSTAKFHAWRRRTKELVYQLDLVSRLAGRRVRALHGEIHDVADELSTAVDLIMVREFVATYAQGLGTGHIADLADTIDARLDDAMTAARKASRAAFARTPRALARKLARAIRKDRATVHDGAADHAG